jgi:heat shock protein HtpX
MNENKTYYQTQAADWRGQLARNHRKTIVVIGIFIFIYAALGFLLDLYIHGAFMSNAVVQGQHYGNQAYINSGAGFGEVFISLLTFKIIPGATIILGVVAIIAVMITFSMHDRLMLLGTKYYAITPKTARNLEEQQLYNIVEEMKIAAGVRYMPKIYVIEADYMNAFASGYSEKSALIAVTQGLMKKLKRDELQAVIAHEFSHIRHGDIKLTLIASVLSNIMLIVIDLLFYNMLFSRDNRQQGNAFVVIIIVLRFLLPLITVLLMLYLSRTREYMADAGSVELVRDNNPLAKALIKISQDQQDDTGGHQSAYMKTSHEDIRRAAYIFDPFKDGLHPLKSMSTLISTHPSIADRLKAIGFKAK